MMVLMLDLTMMRRQSSFIAGLFLTHRGFASITQDEVHGDIMIEDLCKSSFIQRDCNVD